MYFTRLPDPTDPAFDEAAHYRRFTKENIIFNASSSFSHCEEHVGCLSLKTLFQGEETYTVDGRSLALRPGQFLILNNDQTYASRIEKGEHTRILSVFFQKDFAASVFHDSLQAEETLLDNPAWSGAMNSWSGGASPCTGGVTPEFYSKLNAVDESLGAYLNAMLNRFDTIGYEPGRANEDLIYLLGYLVRQYRQESALHKRVHAQKSSTRKEIFRRLSQARDLMHSCYSEPLDLDRLSLEASMSVPQLVRQFRSVFGCTPHQYLIRIRLSQAAQWLRTGNLPVNEITWRSGFMDTSAFCRTFKTRYGTSPEAYRRG